MGKNHREQRTRTIKEKSNENTKISEVKFLAFFFSLEINLPCGKDIWRKEHVQTSVCSEYIDRWTFSNNILDHSKCMISISNVYYAKL